MAYSPGKTKMAKPLSSLGVRDKRSFVVFFDMKEHTSSSPFDNSVPNRFCGAAVAV